MDYQNPAGFVVVALPGEVDATNAESMRERLRSAFSSGVAVVIADMTSTLYCDTFFCRNLIIANDHAVAAGGELRLAINAGGAVRRILEILGLDCILPVYPSVAAAQAASEDAAALASTHGKAQKARNA